MPSRRTMVAGRLTLATSSTSMASHDCRMSGTGGKLFLQSCSTHAEKCFWVTRRDGNTKNLFSRENVCVREFFSWLRRVRRIHPCAYSVRQGGVRGKRAGGGRLRSPTAHGCRRSRPDGLQPQHSAPTQRCLWHPRFQAYPIPGVFTSPCSCECVIQAQEGWPTKPDQ